MSKNLRRWLGLGICVAVVALAFYNLSRGDEWQGFDWTKVWLSVRTTQPIYLGAAIITAYLTYVLRAYRWKFFLDPIKKASLWNLFVGQILGFSAVYLIGRWGEFVRPAYIARKEELTFTSQAAVWFLERIYDMLSVVLLFAVALSFGPLQPGTAHARHILRATRWVGFVIIIAAVLIVGILMVFRLHAEELTSGTPKLFRSLSPRWQERAKHFLQSFAGGLEVVDNWRDFLYSVGTTLLLWICNASVFWLVMRSMGGELARLSWFAATLVLVFSVLGMLAPLPGVGGGFQVLAIYVMTGFFQVGPEHATAASIMLWLIIAVPCVLLGLVLLIYEGLSFEKLGKMAEKARAAATEKA